MPWKQIIIIFLIQQFLIKKFSKDKEHVYYYDKASEKLSIVNSKHIFSSKNLYLNKEKYPQYPDYLEDELAKLENKIANIINEKILGHKEIILKRYEVFLIRKFFWVQSFRSSRRKEQYSKKRFDFWTYSLIEPLAIDDDFTKIWYNDIEEILNCNSIEEFFKSKRISQTSKDEFLAEERNYFMTFVKPTEQEFILTDVYPTTEISRNAPFPLHLYQFFPIASNLLIVFNFQFYRKRTISLSAPGAFILKDFDTSKLSRNILTEPVPSYNGKKYYIFSEDNEFYYKAQRISKSETPYINCLFLNEAKIGIAFNIPKNVLFSLNEYESYSDDDPTKKSTYKKFIKEIESL